MMKSPFLDQEVLSDDPRPDFDPALARLAKESSFVGALEGRRSRFDEDQWEEEEAPDELEGEEKLEAEELEEDELTPQTDQAEDESLDDEGAPLREDEMELESPEMGDTEFFDEEPFLDGETGVINGDNRVRITPTIGAPWRWICKIEVKGNREAQPGGGTGVLISNRHVLTAAHVVYEASQNMQNFSIQVIPALDYGDEPFGSYSVSAKPKLPRNYRADGENRLDWDYALLKLNTPVGKETFRKLKGNALCFWGSPQCGANSVFARQDPATLNGKAVFTAGYPRSEGAKKLMCAAGILHSVNQLRRTMWMTADTTPGQSGSPVWINENGRFCLVGVAAAGGANANAVVRVTRELVRQVREWITQDGETPSMIETEEMLESPAVLLSYPEAEHDETPDAEWSPEATTEEAEDFTATDGGEDELELLHEQPLEERFDPSAVPKDVADALGKKAWPLALKLAIQAGWRDENELTNLVFFARHPELPPEKLDPKGPKFKQFSAEWTKILNEEVWKAIQASAENTDLVVSGKEVTDHHRRFFRGKSGKRLKKLVEDAAREVDLNPGLLGTIMMAETRRPQSYLSSEKVSSYHIGADDFYEGRAAIKARIPAYAKVKWDKNQTPSEHLNDAKTNPRIVKTILFDSGPDAVLVTAVYVKFREVRLREIAAELKEDFDNLPLATRFALTRMAMAAGTSGATPFLKDALKGEDIFIRKAIPVRAYQTQRNATVRTAQAMHLSDWIFGIPVPAAAPHPELETFADYDEYEFKDEEFEDDACTTCAHAELSPTLTPTDAYEEPASEEAESEELDNEEEAAEPRAHPSLEGIGEIDIRHRIPESSAQFEGEAWHEQFDPAAPAKLVQLDHWHAPLTPNLTTGGFTAGSPAILLKADMNPGFVDSSDALITDTTANGLQTCLSKLVQAEGALFLAVKSSPSINDRIRVAVVDLTGNKLSQPEFAGWGSTVAMYGASVPKILGLYAAFQVRSDVRRIADQGGITNGLALEKEAKAVWKAKKLPQFPDLVWLFDIRKWVGTTGPVDFTATAIATFKDIMHNCPAGTIIAKASLPFIGSLTWQSSLHHPQRGGLWLKASYCNKGRWSSPVRVTTSHNITALSAATFFTLLAQERLVDAASSADIKKFLRGGCITGVLPSTIPVVASKCGLWREFVHDCVLADDGTVRYAAAVLSRLRTKNDVTAYQKVWNELDALIRKNNQFPKPAC